MLFTRIPTKPNSSQPNTSGYCLEGKEQLSAEQMASSLPPAITHSRIKALTALIFLMFVSLAHGEVISVLFLFNTGVDNSGVLLPDNVPGGTVDPHYQLIQSADLDFPGPQAYVVDGGSNVFSGPWLTNGPLSNWISPRFDAGIFLGQINVPGKYTYRTTFRQPPNCDPVTTSINGQWLTDNAGVDIQINGMSTSQTRPNSFTNFTPFSINSGFVRGLNTLHFEVDNSIPFGPTGLRVEMTGTCDTNDCVAPPANLVGWLTLNEPLGPAAANLADPSNDGTHVGNPTPTGGMVNGALSFDGLDDYVDVPNDPSLNFGTGDFSVDAWIFPTTDRGIRPIVDKFDITGPVPVGFTLALFNNNIISVHMGDGIALTTPGSSPLVAPVGEWTHVAVTVDRSIPGVGKIYVNGQVAPTTFNPPAGSISNNESFRIGEGGPSGSGFFNGRIDEVELFNRALTAAEIQAIFNAGSEGKCRDGVFPQWDVYFCPMDVDKNATTTLCNYSTKDHTYDLQVTGLPEGSQIPGPPDNPGPVGCPSDGPTFKDQNPQNPVIVPAQSCVDVNITLNPFVVTSPDFFDSCYEVTATNRETRNAITKSVKAWANPNWCAAPPMDPVVIREGDSQEMEFTVTNEGTAAEVFDFEFEIMASAPNLSRPMISLNGLPPGQGVTGQIHVEPGESKPISVMVEVIEHVQFFAIDLLLGWDLDGDGEKDDAFTSVAIRSEQALAILVCDPDAPGAIIGTPGNDTLIGTPGDDVIIALSGNDRIIGNGGNDCIDGGDGNDRITTGSGNDIILGGPGNDTIKARNGDNAIDGGPGNDRITSGDGNDRLTGGAGNDNIKAGNGDNAIDGGPGNDRSVSGDGNDKVAGGSGNDSLVAGSGDDEIDGGAGNDSCKNGESVVGCE